MALYRDALELVGWRVEPDLSLLAIGMDEIVDFFVEFDPDAKPPSGY